VREADNLPPYSADVKKSRILNSPIPLWACMACNGCALPLPLCIYIYMHMYVFMYYVVCMYLCICMYNLCMYMYVFMYVYMCAYMCVGMYIYIYIFIYLFIVRTFKNVVSTAEVAIWLGKKEEINPNLNF
jgi:hypothetical protein